MSWIKTAQVNALILIGLLLVFELLCFTVFRSTIRRIDSRYADSSELAFGKGYPSDYFQNVDGRGFDIQPDARAFTRKPVESPPYDVWSNSYGCFDIQWALDGDPVVYLAGDSFTWGYAPFERKFGTLLEANADLTVLKCGVTHTGQRHQFAKFQSVADRLGRFPDAVIVNVSANDIANDFAFPHSQVVNGFLFDDVSISKPEAGLPEIDRLSSERVEERFEFERRRFNGFGQRLRRFVNRYSATAIVLKRVADSLSPPQEMREKTAQAVGIYEIYLISGEYPIDRDFALGSRRAFLDWQSHSVQNGYRLVVSPIPSKHLYGVGYYDGFAEFLDRNGIERIDFEAYVMGQGLEPKSLYWSHDGHFNFAGNAAYAEFLEAAITTD